ncbi:MAG: radical SAM protein [Myxococcota bacterium]
MSGALLVVPPLLKYLAGPLAGPSLLAGVAASEGIAFRIADLNAAWLRAFPVGDDAGGPVGDHARPMGGFAVAARAWRDLSAWALGEPVGYVPQGDDPALALCYEHDRIEAAVDRMARALDWRLDGERPDLVGVSVLWSGQVLGGLVASVLAKRTWTGVPVIWGGAHVAALVPEIVRDPRYGRHVDGFVAGYAEGTFRSLLCGGREGVFVAGEGRAVRAVEERGVVPAFGDLAAYGRPRLTLPAQTGRGCAYAKCAFCTYPAIEGAARDLDLAALAAVVAEAEARGAEVAVKDALATPARLDAIANVVRGRVRWAACTRLVPRLGRARLARLVDAGLRTLEVGVESLEPAHLARLRKAQPPALVEDLLRDAEGLDVTLVLNTMCGFPGQTEAEADAERIALAEAVAHHPGARVHVERNRLQVERRAPLAATPERFGIRLGRSWPWSSIHLWEPLPAVVMEVA